MVNTTKKTTSKTAASPAAPATPAKTAAPKKAVAKKAEPEASKVEAKATSENIIVESKIDTIADDSLGDQFSEFMGKLQSLSSLLSTLKNDFRVLEKKCLREVKVARKLNEKRQRNRGTRAPSGFVKPTLVTDALADFLGKPHGIEMARTEVTLSLIHI